MALYQQESHWASEARQKAGKRDGSFSPSAETNNRHLFSKDELQRFLRPYRTPIDKVITELKSEGDFSIVGGSLASIEHSEHHNNQVLSMYANAELGSKDVPAKGYRIPIDNVSGIEWQVKIKTKDKEMDTRHPEYGAEFCTIRMCPVVVNGNLSAVEYLVVDDLHRGQTRSWTFDTPNDPSIEQNVIQTIFELIQKHEWM